MIKGEKEIEIDGDILLAQDVLWHIVLYMGWSQMLPEAFLGSIDIGNKEILRSKWQIDGIE